MCLCPVRRGKGCRECLHGPAELLFSNHVPVKMELSMSHLLSDELLPQELPGFEHVGDVVQRTETFVFVLVLLLEREEKRQNEGRVAVS